MHWRWLFSAQGCWPNLWRLPVPRTARLTTSSPRSTSNKRKRNITFRTQCLTPFASLDGVGAGRANRRRQLLRNRRRAREIPAATGTRVPAPLRWIAVMRQWRMRLKPPTMLRWAMITMRKRTTTPRCSAIRMRSGKSREMLPFMCGWDACLKGWTRSLKRSLSTRRHNKWQSQGSGRMKPRQRWLVSSPLNPRISNHNLHSGSLASPDLPIFHITHS